MKIVDAEQGSLAWIDARLGKPTASRAADFAARTKAGKPTAARAKYAYELVAERLVGPKPQVTTAAMQRGLDQEPEAVEIYMTRTGRLVEPVGFVTPDHGRWGASPDGLVGADGLIEVKTSAPHVFVADCLEASDLVPARFMDQIVMLLLVTERLWCDLVQYCEPLGSCRILRVEASDEALSIMATELHEFAAEVDALEARALELLDEWSVVPDLDEAERF